MPNQNLTRRRFLASAGLAAVGGVALEAAYFGPRRLSVTRHALGSPGAFDPIRLAVITDLHLKGVDDLHESLATSLRAADPNCIVLVGDSIDSPEGLPLLSEFLDLLPAEPSRFATLGNWEHWSGVSVDDLRRTYAASSTRLLVNEGVEVETHAHVFGTDDSLAGSPDVAGLQVLEGETLLLSHCPEFRDTLGDAPVMPTAVISGHTHGGQVNVAGWAPIRPPGSGRYVAGWYSGDGPDLFVSRGIGTSVIPFRFGSSPELAVIDWHPRRS